MDERRQFVRLDTRLAVTYRVLPKAPTVSATTKDISGGGLCVLLDEPLKIGTAVQIEIALPDRKRPIAFTGEVVWCEQYRVIGKSQQYQSVMAGVKFVKIRPTDQQAIMQHVILSMQSHPASSPKAS